MLVADNIAKIIEEMLNSSNGVIELKRNDMATRLGCVPSQISYVIASRFTPERGYIIESHKGGGGYIRIARIKLDKDDYLMHFFHAIGNTIDEAECKAYVINLIDNEIINEKEAKIMLSALIGSALDGIPYQYKGMIRADIMKHMIMSLI